MTLTMMPEPPTAGTGSDFALLSERIARAGLMQRRPAYYALRIAAVAAAYIVSVTVFVLTGDSWAQMVVAAAMSIVFVQVALVAHDLAHRQVFQSRRRSQIAGMIAGNLGIGMSYGWWMDKHTRHHANPNHEERDPDVAPDLLVWSADQARAAKGLPRFIGRWQAYLFFPLLLLEGLNLHVASGRALLGRQGMRGRTVEILLFAAHVIGYLGVVFAVLPVGKALLFIAIHQGLFGLYLGCTFAPNHKGMPMAHEGMDFLRKQVLTSRDVTGSRLMDAALGGLNHQIEHHLFPSMPSPNLRRAKPIVRQFCAEIGVPYQETGLIDSYRLALRHLYEVGAPVRKVSPG
ncbi:delta fatty acid desaturase [Rhizocola hellebori]|uniref:Delta fatty acid desaturase n=1 Tax=Rhizocola hellebori TaxID=1392758 RepID=A0A8J3VF38_9ACTN|nr:acyl-CoA desaturase [Rhizocola hellebori]GIH03553.1 delta fatty acid desaturase [Rhizocola hellebori]